MTATDYRTETADACTAAHRSTRDIDKNVRCLLDGQWSEANDNDVMKEHRANVYALLRAAHALYERTRDAQADTLRANDSEILRLQHDHKAATEDAAAAAALAVISKRFYVDFTEEADRLDYEAWQAEQAKAEAEARAEALTDAHKASLAAEDAHRVCRNIAALLNKSSDTKQRAALSFILDAANTASIAADTAADSARRFASIAARHAHTANPDNLTPDQARAKACEARQTAETHAAESREQEQEVESKIA